MERTISEKEKAYRRTGRPSQERREQRRVRRKTGLTRIRKQFSEGHRRFALGALLVSLAVLCSAILSAMFIYLPDRDEERETNVADYTRSYVRDFEDWLPPDHPQRDS